MIRVWARRCTPRRGRATWCDASAQRCTISTTPASATKQRPRRQHSTQSDAEERARRARHSSDHETDWRLWKDHSVPVPEQEALFIRYGNGGFGTKIKAPCPACEMQHDLASCPFVFEDNPWHFRKPKKETREFNGRMDNSQEFHDAVVYIRRKFAHRLPNGNQVRVPRSETQDAPPLARRKRTYLPGPTVHSVDLDVASAILIVTVWLSNFDMNVRLEPGRSLDAAQSFLDRWNYRLPPFSAFQGYYPTTDHDGRRFLIVYTNSGHFDDWTPYGMSSSCHFLPILHLPRFALHRLSFALRSDQVLRSDMTCETAEDDYAAYRHHQTT